MHEHSYLEKRSQLQQYFDRTAFDAWAKLTSTAPVSGIRKTVRAGRDARREATSVGGQPAHVEDHGRLHRPGGVERHR
mgnify:CR=1 FL=1